MLKSVENKIMAKDKTKNFTINEFAKQILTDKRYWILLVLFILLLFFGQNIPTNSNTNLSPQNDTSPKIGSNGMAYAFPDILDSREGDVYHLLFQTKAQFISVDSSSATPVQEKIQLNLTNDFGDTTIVSSIDVPINSSSFTSNDLTFTTNGQYQNLIFQKTDPTSQSEVFIKNVHLVRLEGPNPIEPSFVGSFYMSTQVENFNISNANKYILLDKKNTTIGQTFTAQSDYLTGVTLKLHFRGNGGSGNYHLAIREVVNGKTLGDDLAGLDFNNPASDTLYQIVAGVYHIPVNAKLIRGKQYLVSVDNKNVQTNFLNALEICTTNNSALDPSDQSVFVNQKGEIKNKAGDFYIKYDFADQPTYNGGSANFGDIFDDLGDGTGDYSYSENGLDVLESGKNFIIYKINTFYTFNLFYLEASLNITNLSGDYHLFYSFNDKDWQEITEDQQAAGTGKFVKQIQGGESNKIVYIKAMGTVFGSESVNFNSLNVHATVKTNN